MFAAIPIRYLILPIILLRILQGGAGDQAGTRVAGQGPALIMFYTDN